MNTTSNHKENVAIGKVCSRVYIDKIKRYTKDDLWKTFIKGIKQSYDEIALMDSIDNSPITNTDKIEKFYRWARDLVKDYEPIPISMTKIGAENYSIIYWIIVLTIKERIQLNTYGFDKINIILEDGTIIEEVPELPNYLGFFSNDIFEKDEEFISLEKEILRKLGVKTVQLIKNL